MACSIRWLSLQGGNNMQDCTVCRRQTYGTQLWPTMQHAAQHASRNAGQCADFPGHDSCVHRRRRTREGFLQSAPRWRHATHNIQHATHNTQQRTYSMQHATCVGAYDYRSARVPTAPTKDRSSMNERAIRDRLHGIRYCNSTLWRTPAYGRTVPPWDSSRHL